MWVGSSHFKNVGFEEGTLQMMKEDIEFVVKIVNNEKIFSEKRLKPWNQAVEISKFGRREHLDGIRSLAMY